MVPSQNQLILPLLAAIEEAGGTMRPKDAADAIAEKLELTPEERQHCGVTPKGKRYNSFDRTVRWTQQLGKLRELTTNEGTDGFWSLTARAGDKLGTISPGLCVTVWENDLGIVLWGAAEAVEKRILDNSIDLIVSSPPYELTRPKEYDAGRSESDHVQWLVDRASVWKSKLAPTGSLILNLGDVWLPNSPTMSLYQEKLLIELVERLGYHLCQKLVWHNKSALPSPAEWVTVRRIRVNPASENVWWLSPSEFPKADNRNVLVPYSESMKRTLEKGTNAGVRPSGHVVSSHAFSRDCGGAVPHNVLEIANTSSNDRYLEGCRKAGIPPHPARFPKALPEFAIKLTTDEGDTCWDPFSGSLTTAAEANRLNRHWIANDQSRLYLDGGLFRFDRTNQQLATFA